MTLLLAYIHAVVWRLLPRGRGSGGGGRRGGAMTVRDVYFTVFAKYF